MIVAGYGSKVGDEMLTGKSVGYDEIVSVELGVIFRAWDFCVFSARIMPDNALPVGFLDFENASRSVAFATRNVEARRQRHACFDVVSSSTILMTFPESTASRLTLSLRERNERRHRQVPR
jgi:hypothetical protein